MGCFCVAWPSSQCCSKLRNHRHHLSSTITLMVIKAQPGTAKITYVGGKYCFGSPCKIFPLKYSLYYHLDSYFVFFLLLFLLMFPTVTKIILTSFLPYIYIYIYIQSIYLFSMSFSLWAFLSLWSKLGVGYKCSWKLHTKSFIQSKCTFSKIYLFILMGG